MTRTEEMMQMILDASEQAGEAMTGAVNFDLAGAVCIGPDAEIRQGCAAMLEAFSDWMLEGSIFGYEPLVKRLTDRAEAVAPLRASTAEGRRAKAAIVHKLNQIGLAGYAGRILAASLALDVLGGER